MWTLTINGIDIYHIISWFLIYSFLGWYGKPLMSP